MNKLSGKKIVIAGSRKIDEMSVLIEKQGGIPIVRSLQGLLFFDELAVEKELLFCADNKVDWFVLTTGTGTEALLTAAKHLQIHSEMIRKMKEAKLAVRGYKTYALLKRLGIQPEVVDEDGTTEGLIKSLLSYDFAGKTIVVQLHGEPQPSLIQFLEERGADVIPILPYQHIEPEFSTLERLCFELSTYLVDAVCFTTAVQVRYLFEYARRQGTVDTVREAFSHHVKAAAVGKVTAEALRDQGVRSIIVPESERMGAMIIELARYYDRSKLF